MKSGVIIIAVLTVAPLGRADLANGIKAVVNDQVITYEQVERLTQQTADVLVRDFRSNPEELNRKMNQARNENLEKLMERELILTEFQTAGYALPDSVLEELVQERIRSRYGDRRTLTKTLQAQGITFERFRQQVKEQFIVEALRQKNISAEILISPYKLERYYLQNTNEFKVNEQVKLRAIILSRGGNTNPQQTRALANEILLKLKEGAAFEEMAGIYSQGAERKEGGLRPLQEIRELRQELADAVHSLKPGDLSGVIETPEAYWILKIEEKVLEHIKPLAEVRDQIEKDLLAKERARLEKQWLDKLRKKTFVRYF